MRKVIAAAFVSLDGVMQAPGGPEEDPAGSFTQGGWTFHYWDEMMGQAMGGILAAPFDLLLGRKTYDIFAGHWPFMEDSPIAATFNAVTKYVATSSTAPLTWTNSVALHNPAADVARLKQQDGPDLLLQGSSQLIQTLLTHGLIDRFNLLIFPLVLGKGKRLFGDGTEPAGLRLVDTKASTTGVILSTYVPAGAIQTGSFARATPSDAELGRRERMKRES